jgi:hypothetical protein
MSYQVNINGLNVLEFKFQCFKEILNLTPCDPGLQILLTLHLLPLPLGQVIPRVALHPSLIRLQNHDPSTSWIPQPRNLPRFTIFRFPMKTIIMIDPTIAEILLDFAALAVVLAEDGLGRRREGGDDMWIQGGDSVGGLCVSYLVL